MCFVVSVLNHIIFYRVFPKLRIMRKQGSNFLVEHIKGLSSDEARYGIATVQPNRGIKKCRIRNIWVEYLITERDIVLIAPKPCRICEQIDGCTEDFVLHVIEKYNNRQDKSGTHYYLRP